MRYGQGHGGITGVAGEADQQAAARQPTPAPAGPLRPLLLLLALLCGLGLAALCLHAGSGGDVLGQAGPLHGGWVLIMLMVAVGGWILTAKYYGRQNERPLGTAREGRMITLTVTCLVLTVLGTCVGLVLLGLSGAGPNQAPPPPQPTFTDPPPRPNPVVTSQPARSSPLHAPHLVSIPDLLLVLLVLALTALLVAVVLAARRYLHFRTAPAPELYGTLEAPVEEAALSAAVSAGRLALHGEDVRAAVIACYAAMEDSLAAGGLGHQASDSPAELLQRAAEAGLLVGLAPQQLAALFREARYSSHPMTREQLTRARAALDDIGTLLAERGAARAAELAAAEAARAAAVNASLTHADEVQSR